MADLPSFPNLLGETVKSWVKLDRMRLDWERVTKNGFLARAICKQDGLPALTAPSTSTVPSRSGQH